MFTWRTRIPTYRGHREYDFTPDDCGDQPGKGLSTNIAAFSLAWITLIADSPLDGAKPANVVNRFVSDIRTDLFGTIELYTELGYLLTLIREKRDDGTSIGPYEPRMQRTPVFREYLHYYRTGDPSILQYLLSFLWFGKKLEVDNPAIDAQALRSWLEIEDHLSSLKLPAWVCNLKPFVAYCLQTWAPDYFLPKHGSGAVAEHDTKSIQKKCEIMKMTRTIATMYTDYGAEFRSLDDFVGPLPEPSSAFEQLPDSIKEISRLKFVPKTWNKRRTICMEPATFQWTQQAVRLWLEAAIDTGPLANHVFLHDQTVNQAAALFGSQSNEIDTIDLSAASDSMSWDLIQRIMPREVLRHLEATRTHTVKLPGVGKLFEVSKYAPMGSALCFPVQTIVYASVIMMVAYASRWGEDWTVPGTFDKWHLEQMHTSTFRRRLEERRPSEDHRYHPFYVYGDDLAVDFRLSSNVIRALTQLGFKVNEAKSYLGAQNFRESCGVFAIEGYNVTPLLFKTKPISQELDCKTLSSLIDLANRAKLYGYAHLRSVLINMILRMPLQGIVQPESGLNEVLFTTDPDDSFAIMCDRPRNKHLSQRIYNSRGEVATTFLKAGAKQLVTMYFNLKVTGGRVPTWFDESDTRTRYQRDEYLSLTLGPDTRTAISEKFDNYRYGVWWRSQYGRNGKTGDIVGEPTTAETMGVSYSWRWTPTGSSAY